MIIDKKDIQELDRYLEDFHEFETNKGWDPEEPSVVFFGERPHLLLPVGFDESQSIADPEGTDDYWSTFDPNLSHEAHLAALTEARYGIAGVDFTFGVEWLYRRSSSGAWYWFEGLDNNHLLFRGPAADPKLQISIEDLYGRLRRFAESPDALREHYGSQAFGPQDFSMIPGSF